MQKAEIDVNEERALKVRK